MIHYRTDSLLLDVLKFTTVSISWFLRSWRFITEQIYWFELPGDSLPNKYFSFTWPEIHYQTNSLVLHSQRFITEQFFFYFKYPEIHYQTNPVLLLALKFITEQMTDLTYPKVHYWTEFFISSTRRFISEQIPCFCAIVCPKIHYRTIYFILCTQNIHYRTTFLILSTHRFITEQIPGCYRIFITEFFKSHHLTSHVRYVSNYPPFTSVIPVYAVSVSVIFLIGKMIGCRKYQRTSL